MKYLTSIFVCAMVLLLSSSQIENVDFARVDPFEKIFRESANFTDINDTVEVASGESATFQFAIRSENRIQNLRVNLTELTSDKNNKLTGIESGFVGYTHVGVCAPGRAKDVVIPPSRFYPDPIFTNPSCDVGRDMAQSMWITVKIPHKTKAGLYTGTVKVTGEITGQPFSFEKKVSVRVYPIEMEYPSLEAMYCYYSSPNEVHHFDKNIDSRMHSDGYWKYIKAIADKMHECNQTVAFLQPWLHWKFTEKDGKYTFDFSQFDRVIEIFLKAGVNKRIGGGIIGGKLGNNKCGLGVPIFDKNGNQHIENLEVTNPLAQNFYRQFLPALMKHLKAKKWDKKYVQRLVDEPTENDADSYLQVRSFVKSLAPGLTTSEACSMTRDGAMDVWVPVLDYCHDHFDFFQRQQKNGGELWFYTCCGPQGEYSNHYVELPAIKIRLLHWINYKYGVTGYLHWAFNAWSDDVYKECAVIEDGGSVLPGGDCWIVYPSGDGRIFGSIRTEAMRDGIADHTLLTMLGRKNPALAKELCGDIIYDWTKYNTSSKDFKNIRHRILTALSK